MIIYYANKLLPFFHGHDDIFQVLKYLWTYNNTLIPKQQTRNVYSDYF